MVWSLKTSYHLFHFKEVSHGFFGIYILTTNIHPKNIVEQSKNYLNKSKKGFWKGGACL